jgi:hypothetical protein
MNQVIILGFTRTSGDVDPASVAQAPMRLPQHRDGLGPQLLLFAVQHLDGQLFICKIWLNIKRLVVNHM